MKRAFLEAINHRRSIYQLDNVEIVPIERIEEILVAALAFVPSAFNSQSTRIVLLTQGNHKRLWDIVKDELRAIVPEQAFAASETKIDTSFASGYATVLFYEDMDVVAGLQKQFAPYADRFPVWSEQTSAMHQFAVWTMVEDDGAGASLQHYNPIIDQQVASTFGISNRWRLVAQMPIGRPITAPAPKDSSSTASHLVVL